MFEIKYKIWVEKNGKSFGKGVCQLLEGVKRYGSLSAAAKELGMSYNKAFNMIKEIEDKYNFKLIERKAGGNKGGGSYLTSEGDKFLNNYYKFYNECEESLDKVFSKYFNNN